MIVCAKHFFSFNLYNALDGDFFLFIKRSSPSVWGKKKGCTITFKSSSTFKPTCSFPLSCNSKTYVETTQLIIKLVFSTVKPIRISTSVQPMFENLDAQENGMYGRSPTEGGNHHANHCPLHCSNHSFPEISSSESRNASQRHNDINDVSSCQVLKFCCYCYHCIEGN